jgi:hypothetical protein
VRDPALFLRGFCLDMPPGGCYIWKYYLPLFSNDRRLDLRYGYRVNGGYISGHKKSRDQFFEDLISIIDKNDNFNEEETLLEAYNFAKHELASSVQRNGLLRDIRRVDSDSIIELMMQASQFIKSLDVE